MRGYALHKCCNIPVLKANGCKLILIMTVAVISIIGCDRDTGDAVEIKQTFLDEFEGEAGESIDTTVWNYDVGTGWGNNQLEYDTDRTTNVYLDGSGNLAITAREESYLNCDYTSGRITTRDNFEQAYGRFEARIKLPVGKGIWPAFWMLGDNFPETEWPDCGEIDIMEFRGQEPGVLLGAVHGPGYSGGSAISRRLELEDVELNEDYHIFAIEWEPDRIRWMLDGEVYHTVTPKDLPSGSRWVFDHPFFIILNVAVGGTFVGPPDQSTEFPQTMLVDWIRVFSSGYPINASAVCKPYTDSF